MSDHDQPDPLDDDLPEQLRADIVRWRAAQPPLPALDEDVIALSGGGGHRRSRRRVLVPLGAAAAAVAVATGVVLGTGSGKPGTSPTSHPPVGVGARLIGHVQPVTLGRTSAQDVASGQTAFGLDLLARRCAAHPTSNDVLSPASAALALAMLDTGAAGPTRASLSRLLHLPPWSPQLLAALRAQHEALSGLDQLKVSNHLYTQVGVHPAQQVLDDLATAEAAYLQTLDLARHAQQATDAINAAVDADTRGLIHKLFDNALDPSTTTVLTNALYLDAAWKTPFLPAQSGDFTTAAGAVVKAPLMSSAGDVGQLRHSGGWTSATLPYLGGKLEAVVLLPNSTAADPVGPACAAPTALQFAGLTSGPATSGTVTMPTLHLSQTSQLAGDLAALGLPVAGDYSGFGSLGSISEVVQKTVLQVDEHGTKAAAATGLAIATALRPGVTANRPYLLLIQDTATRTPLFLARINDPTATG